MSIARVKLSNYSGHKKYDRESATLIEFIGDFAIIKFCDGKRVEVPRKKIIHVNTKKYSLPEYRKIAKINDWVRTNGDGGEKENILLEGQIGEIGIMYDEFEKKDRPAIFIWQNTYPATMGKKDPKSKEFNYSWVVYLDNSNAFIEKITGKKDGPKVYCERCGSRVNVFDSKNIKDEIWCIFCVQLECKKCIECGELEILDNMTKHDKKLYCNPCYKKVIKKCNRCEKKYHKNYITKSTSNNLL